MSSFYFPCFGKIHLWLIASPSVGAVEQSIFSHLHGKASGTLMVWQGSSPSAQQFHLSCHSRPRIPEPFNSPYHTRKCSKKSINMPGIQPACKAIRSSRSKSHRHIFSPCWRCFNLNMWWAIQNWCQYVLTISNSYVRSLQIDSVWQDSCGAPQRLLITWQF